jgi:UDP-N-acetylglucosamine:LPS N-acetylglucosamine transferase
MKRVLVLTAGFGEGHNTAARNLVSALESAEAEAVDVRLMDPLATSFGSIYEFLRKAYLEMIAEAAPAWGVIYKALDNGMLMKSSLEMFAPARIELARIVSELRPHAAVSTFPLYPYLWEQLYPQASGCPFSRITVVTDSITLNSMWYRAFSDAWVAPNDETGSVLEACGVPPGKIYGLGFPVDPKFGEPGVEPVRPPSRTGSFSVLLMVNQSQRGVPELVDGLLSVPDIRLTITVSRDPAIERDLAAIIGRRGANATLLGWTDRLPELFAANHLLIGKAGGATVQEAIAARIPMIVNRVVPGQEEGNARLLVETGAGAVATDTAGILSELKRAMADEAKVWLDWKRAMERLSRPGASRDIARFVLAACHP